jgi:hypothetical protein
LPYAKEICSASQLPVCLAFTQEAYVRDTVLYMLMNKEMQCTLKHTYWVADKAHNDSCGEKKKQVKKACCYKPFPFINKRILNFLSVLVGS